MRSHEPVEIDPRDRPLLEKIGRLRVLAWATVLPDEAARVGCWLDEFELSARHWCIFHDREPVAAARVSFHDRIAEVPDAEVYANLALNPPIASINRLVTHPDFRGRGFSEKLDAARLAVCSDVFCIVAHTEDFDRRVPQLEALGFERVGGLVPNPGGTFYANLPTQPLIRRAKLSSGIQQTANRLGWSGTAVNEVSREFIRFAGKCKLPVLDIGAAYGVATLPALVVGAAVIANDLAPDHLAEMERRTPVVDRPRLTLLSGRFPDGFDLPPGSLGAVHASQVFHFLTGDEITRGLAAVFRWLQPNGRLFLLAATPYQATHAGFAPVFAERKARGEQWPGVIARYKDYNSHWSAELNPATLHVFDDEVLAAAVRAAGFVVESARMFSRTGLPDFTRHDGRENLGVIAGKPSA
jgi:SAM-dependent methyltransferase